MLNALTASLFFWVHLDTLMMQCQIRGTHTKMQRWSKLTKLWWQSHNFQDILQELTQPKTKASLTEAKVVAYSHWLTVHYSCLCSHALPQESLIPWQHSPHTYVHSGKGAERKSPHARFCAQELCLVEAVGGQTSLVTPLPSLEQLLAPRCSAAPSLSALWGLSKGGANHPKILRTAKSKGSRNRVGLFMTHVKFLV